MREHPIGMIDMRRYEHAMNIISRSDSGVRVSVISTAMSVLQQYIVIRIGGSGWLVATPSDAHYLKDEGDVRYDSIHIEAQLAPPPVRAYQAQYDRVPTRRGDAT